MSRLVLHLGLPKTGTTTLQQDVFPNLNCIYIGVKQPRSLPQDLLWTLVSDYIIGAKNIDLEIVREELSKRLREGELLISEEMLLVDSLAAGVVITWQIKLRRLARLLEGLCYEIIITLREPLEGLESYYREIARFGKELYGCDFSDFIMSANRAKIFQYHHLHRELTQVFNDTAIKYFTFESLFSNGGYQVLARSIDFSEKKPISVKVRNKNVAGEGIVIKKPNAIAKLLRKNAIVNQEWCGRALTKVIDWNTRRFTPDFNLSDKDIRKLKPYLEPAEAFWRAVKDKGL